MTTPGAAVTPPPFTGSKPSPPGTLDFLPQNDPQTIPLDPFIPHMAEAPIPLAEEVEKRHYDIYYS